MKYKSKNIVLYWLLLVSYIFFDQIERCFTPGLIFFHIANIAAYFLALGLCFYETRARIQFEKEQGDLDAHVNKGDIVFIILIVIAIVVRIFNPFGG